MNLNKKTIYTNKKKNETARKADQKNSAAILEEFHKRSFEIEQLNFVTKNYDQFAKTKIDSYFDAFMGSMSKISYIAW